MDRVVLQIKALARQHGFALAGLTPAAGSAEDERRLTRWVGSGYHGAMDYLARRPDERADARKSAPEARTMLMLGMNYFQGEAEERPPSAAMGRVARYARGGDYHALIGARLEALAAEIATLATNKDLPPLPALRWRPYVDALPLLERQYAERAGLGFLGKNGCLIHPETGSWYFLAALALSWELPPDGPIEGTCGRCTRCLEACPTDAFPQPGVLDARRCISYLTIEQREEIEEEDLRRGLGDWVLGCDICQDVCPYNKFSTPTAETELLGPAFVDLRLLAAHRENRTYNAATEGTPLRRPGRRGMQRTVAEVTANRAEELRARIAAGEASEEDAEMTAAWAELEALAAELAEIAATERENPRLASQIERALKRYRAARNDGA